MNRTRHPGSLRMAVGKLLGGLGLALAIGSSAGCMVAAHGSGTFRTGGVIAYEAPPPPRQEAYEQRSGQVWIKGRWDWQNGGWQWMPGHWENERAGYQYQEGQWTQGNGQWNWNEGQWVVVSGGAVVTGGGYDRPQVVDHRDGGGYVPPPPPPNNGGYNGGYNGGTGYVPPPPPGGLTATNGAGTVIVGNGGVTIVGPTMAPPPVRMENPGAGRGGHIWVKGHWQWGAGQYDWIPGHWEREKAGYQWYDGQWQQQGNGWIWIEGEWRVNAQTPQVNVRDRRTH